MNERTKEFLELVKANPDLRILPLVAEDVVADDSYYRWYGSFGISYLGEICCPEGADRFFLKSDIDGLEEWIYDNYFSGSQYDDMPAEDVDALVKNKLNEILWEKVIIVNVDSAD